MTPALAVRQPDIAPAPPVRVRFRAALPTDEGYILDSWRLSWRLAPRNHRLPGADYGRKFDALVRSGVLAQRDTAFVVGCAPDRVDEIWSWLCYTPGEIPTVHYAVTKRHVASLDCSPRGIGLLARMLAAAGIRSSLVYTFRPGERIHASRAEPIHVERGLLEAAERAGITATYHSVEEFLAHRGSR